MINVNKSIKKTAIILFVLLLIPFQKNFSQSNSFYIYFMQNGKRVNIKKDKVELKKAQFKMFAEYIEPVDLLVSVSDKAKTYNKAEKGKLMFKIPAFQNSKKHKSLFFEKNKLPFCEENYSIWEKGKTDGNKDLISKKNHIVVSKNIETVFDAEDNETIQIKDIKKKLYFVFIYAEKDKEGDYEEIQREIVKIKWVDDYYKDTKTYARKKKRDDKIKINQAKRQLKRKQRLAKQEEKRLKKLEKHKLKKAEKEKKKLEKKKKSLKKKTISPNNNT